jgi:hypothetical protein
VEPPSRLRARAPCGSSISTARASRARNGPPSASLPAAAPGPPMPPAAHPVAGSWSQRSPAPSESITPACHAANVAGGSFTRAWAIANRFIALLHDNRNAIPTSSGANSPPRADHTPPPTDDHPVGGARTPPTTPLDAHPPTTPHDQSGEALDQLRVRKTTTISTTLVQFQRQPPRGGAPRCGQLLGVL